MPHCQKENHNHTAKSKKERQKKKEALQARKKAAKTGEEEELEKGPNNLALADGFGEYIVGCEEERKFQARFNMNKRSKKHLRLDIRKQTLEKERKEEERKQREQEERYCQEQEEKRRQENNDNIEEEEEEEPPIVTEYFVYICQCCQKKFNTTNQFANHTKSKRHKENAKLYEEAGIIVTEVQLRKDHEDDNDYLYGGDGVEDGERGEDDTIHGLAENDEDSSYSEEDEPSSDEEDHKMKKVGSLFCAMAAFTSDSESSSSESEMSEEENDDSGDAKDIRNVGGVASINNDSADDASEYAGSDYEDDLDLLEEIIYQNRVQKSVQNLNGNEKNEDEEGNVESATPVYFDDEQYDPDFLSASENRVAAVQYRLQKRLAAKGIQPNQSINQSHLSTQAVTVGKTLLQQVMQANIDTLEARLAAYNRHKEQCQLLGREFRFARGNSKALPSQYTYRIDPSDNRRQRENVHHTGSHYHMQQSRSMQFGRTKGMMARHSSQGSRLQASRMAAKEMAKVHGKGMKIGKTSKKSQQKRRGEAGGSKKSGGTATGEN